MKVSIKDIIKNMPKELSEIEKVRYIYIEVAKILSYKRDFLYLLDDRFMEDIYTENITIDSIENSDYQNKISAVCKQHAEILCETLNSLYEPYINARTIGYNKKTFSHVNVIATVCDNSYYLDINPDLYRVQKGMKTVGFANSNNLIDETECQTISEEELKRIDKKIGYCKYGMYMNDAIQMLKSEMLDEENWAEYMKEYDLNTETKEDIILKCKIDFIFQYLKNYLQEENKLGIVEIDKYYSEIFKRLLTKEEKDNSIINAHDIYIKNKEKGLEESLLYRIEMKNGILYYLYKDKERGFVKMSLSELIEMHKNGEIQRMNNYMSLGFEYDTKEI